MGRKKTFPTGDAVNPLQRMFGTFLRLERSRLGYSSKDVADKFRVSDTYLRLAESGRAALNQSLVFTIIQVLADSNAPTHDSRTIIFSRLALLTVGTHWVGAEMALYSGKDAGKQAIEALALRVSDFQHFLDITKEYFDLQEDSAAQKEFLENVAAPEVGEFLRNEAYGGTDTESLEKNILPLRELLDLPTLNLELVLDLKQALSGRSFVHTADVASKWESQRKTQFRYERGLYARAELIVSDRNLDKFHFEHLSETGFREVQMIFLDGDEKKLKDDFINFIDAGRSKAGLKLLKPQERDKIHFRCLTRQERTRHKSKLYELRSRDSDVLEAYWSFQAHSGLHIGFVGVAGDNAENTRNLNFRDSLHRNELFGQVWEAIK